MTPGPSAHRPTSTYRLQIHADFDLFEAARRLPYLHDLGVDWVYLSPLLAAEPGSTHGYDVVAFDHVDESRGGAEGLAALSAEARRARHGRAGRHRAQPRRGGDARAQRLVVGRARARAGTRCTPRRSTSTGTSAGASSWLPVLGDDDLPVDGEPDRAPPGRRTASCATTTTGSRSRPAPTDGTRRRGARAPALRAGQLAPRRLRAELPPLLHRHHAGRGPGRDPRGVRGHARRGPPLVRRGPRRRPAHRPPGRAARPGGLPRPPRRPHRRRLHAGREDPRTRRETSPAAGRWTAPPATTCSRCSTGCSPTRPASSP